MSIQCIKGLFLKKWIIFQRVNAFCKAPFSEADTSDGLPILWFNTFYK